MMIEEMDESRHMMGSAHGCKIISLSFGDLTT